MPGCLDNLQLLAEGRTRGYILGMRVSDDFFYPFTLPWDVLEKGQECTNYSLGSHNCLLKFSYV